MLGLGKRLGFASFLLALTALPAQAHEAGLSYLEVQAEGALVRGTLDAPASDFERTLRLDVDRDGRIGPADIAASEAMLRRWFFGTVRFVGNGEICEGDTFSPRIESNALLRLTGTWKCPGEVAKLEVATRVLDTFGSDHSLFVRAGRGESVRQALLTPEASSVSFDFGAPESALSVFGRFVVLGVEHIFLGIDHVLFLVALLLLGGTLRRIVGVATAFTLAHSVTLSLAALEIVLLPSSLVESIIAASIGWVAVENWVFAAPRVETREPAVLRWRWLITFAFGLLHGFGFASVLTDLGLPKNNLALALGGFNVGVELGQIAIIAVAFPLLKRMEKSAWYRPLGVRVASAVLLVLAVYWFVQRAFGL